MVQKFFSRILYHEISGLHEAAYLLAGFALLSKLLALIRDRFLAYSFGATAPLDIYYAAFRIPDFIYVSLASLVASAVLIPFITERLEKDGSGARHFFNAIFTIFFISIVVVSGIVFIITPLLTPFIAPGLSLDAQEELITLSRIMLLSPILLGLSGLFASVTQTLRNFLAYALTPLLYNVGIIIGIFLFYPHMGLPGLAYGVVLGALLHMVIQLPVLARNRFFPRPTFRINWKEIKGVFLLSLPRTITLSTYHFTLLIFVAIASTMAEGSIAIFNLSFNLQSVPLSIIGVSYSVAAFPTLARLFSNGDRKTFVAHVITAARHIIFWSLPILALFIVLRAQIVRTVLGTGKFDWADTRLTAATLALFVISVAAQSLILLFVRGYYAAGYTKKPLVVTLASFAVTVSSAFVFIKVFNEYAFFQYFIESLFRIEGLSAGGAILMLPLAFSLGALLNAFILWILFKKDFGASSREIVVTLKHSFYAAVVVGFAAHQSLRLFDNIFDLNTFVGIFSQGLLSGIVGVVAGIIVLNLIKNQEIKDVGETLRHRFWKTKPISPDQSEL